MVEMTKVMIKDFQVNQEIDTALLLEEKQLRPFASKPGFFLTVKLRDRTGLISGKVWDDAPGVFERLGDARVVKVTGRVQEYGGELQLVLNNIQEAGGDFSPEDFLPRLENYGEVKEKFQTMLSWIKDQLSEEMAQLLEQVFTPGFSEKFCRVPAAYKYHHAYLGGLMHHTLNVVRNAYTISKNYPGAVDIDLVLLGALLHDVGKVDELSFQASLDYTREGNLLGHIVQGIFLIKKEIEKARERGIQVSQEKETLLLHIIASHHNLPEWGSPRHPQIIEAMFVHYADIIDAEAFKYSALEGEKGTFSWSPLLKRKAYLRE